MQRRLHDYYALLGAGPDRVRCVAYGDHEHSVHLAGSNRVLFGHGATPREAAKRLADQLREQAQLIEALEGIP
jgi:hypothetical protein